MKQAAVQNPVSAKQSLSAGSTQHPGYKGAEKRVSPASPPLWNRYVDCRMKQFTTR
jgi:hypothetical protein